MRSSKHHGVATEISSLLHVEIGNLTAMCLAVETAAVQRQCSNFGMRRARGTCGCGAFDGCWGCSTCLGGAGTAKTALHNWEC